MLFTELPLKKSKHIPYSNKLPSQFVTNTPYVSPLKICRTVVRLVETHSVIKAKCKHLPTITSYVSSIPTKSLTLWGPRNKEYSRALSQHNKNEEHSKEHSSFLVRCRSRHSVSKGPPDLSPKFFRFA